VVESTGHPNKSPDASGGSELIADCRFDSSRRANSDSRGLACLGRKYREPASKPMIEI